MTLKQIIVGCGLILTTPLMACGSTAEKQNKEAKDTHTKDAVVRTIDATYMRQNIFDYKENPNKFVFKGERPAILDFYADWCGPCRSLSPKLVELAKKYKGEIDVYKINVDNEAELARIFGVRSIPMLLFIPMEGPPIQTVGNLSVEELEQTIDKIRVKK